MRRAFRLAAPLGLLACGYHFTAQGGGLPAGVQSVDVPVLQNQTTEAGVEGPLTDALRHRLAELGYRPGALDSATLVASVVGASGGPVAPKVAVTDAGVGVGYAPGLYVVSLAVSAKLLRGDELLWQADNVVLSERYLPSDDLATLEAHRREALARLTRDLARELVSRLTSGL
jgi:hypothetical protein